MMRLVDAKVRCKAVGWMLSVRDGEYMVREYGHSEGPGTNYTNDLEDAVGTAEAYPSEKGLAFIAWMSNKPA